MSEFRLTQFSAAMLLALVTQAGTSFANSGDLTVSQGSFAIAIDARRPAPPIRPGQAAAPGPLWFWSEIRAEAAVLNQLRAERRFPLQHRWYRNVAGIPGPDEPPDFTRDLEEITDSLIDSLIREAGTRGYFTYRTTSCRFDLPAGRWTVVVTDAAGRRVDCPHGDACRFQINVRRGGVAGERCPADR